MDGSKESEPEGLPRRIFLANAGWAYFAGLMGLFAAAIGKFFFPKVLFEPPTAFKIGYPREFPDGVETKLKKERGIWVVREGDRMYAIIAVCTHLGCTPNWLESEKKFKCPCHGSGYYMTGENFEGPAPRPLERAYIDLADDGQILVDKGRKFVRDPGKGIDEWDKHGAYLKV